MLIKIRCKVKYQYIITHAIEFVYIDSKDLRARFPRVDVEGAICLRSTEIRSINFRRLPSSFSPLFVSRDELDQAARVSFDRATSGPNSHLTLSDKNRL